MNSALSHVTVLDLRASWPDPGPDRRSGIWAPKSSRSNARAGATTRALGPALLRDQQGEESADAAYYLCANRNKKSITVDFTTPEGQALVRELARKSDVVLENFKSAGSRLWFGLRVTARRQSQDHLLFHHRLRPDGSLCAARRNMTCSCSHGGLMSITGRADDEQGAAPAMRRRRHRYFDGLYAAIGILAALSHRERTGIGQHIDIGLLDVQVACLANQAMNFLVGGVAPVRSGNAHPNLVPYQDFPTSDGYMIIAVATMHSSRGCAR